MNFNTFLGRTTALSLAAFLPLGFSLAAPSDPKAGASPVKSEPPLEASITIQPPELSPASTIELVFPTVMIAKERINSVEAEPPLVITPPLAGVFKWVSTRSGHYKLGQAPKFDAEYEFSLRPGLRDAAGKAFSSAPLTTANSAPFRVVDQYPKWFNDDDARRKVRLLFEFNDSVSLDSAARALSFVSESPALTVPAKVRLATGADFVDNRADPQQTWAEEAAGAKPNLTKDEARLSALIVEPESPLPVATRWRLRMADTLTNASGHNQIANGTEVHLGDVRPFVVSQVEAHTPFDQPYHLDVVFNKSVMPEGAADLTEQQTAELAQKVMAAVHLDPRPTDLKASISYRTLTLTGAFALNTPYRVTVEPKIVSGDGLTLAAVSESTATFVPNPPYVAAPAFMRAQLASGKGDFSFTAANVSNVRVRVKRLSGSDLLQAVAKYRDYRSNFYTEEKNRQGYKPAPFEDYAGVAVFERSYPVNKPLDQSEVITLNWREILAGAPAAPLFVELEGTAAPGLEQKGVLTQTLVQFTDLGIMQKSNDQDTMVFVTSLQSGQPVQGVRLSLVDGDHRLIGYADTDASGVANIRGPTPALVLAEKAGDCAAIRCGDDSFGAAVPYDIPQAWESVWKPRRKTFIFSDRSLYRPGDTVHLKALTRLRKGDDLLLEAAPATAELTLRDARYRPILTKSISFTASGSWSDDVKLPDGNLGWYNLSLAFNESASGAGTDESSGESGASFTFRVDDYRPNTFEVKLDPAKLEILPDRMHLPLTANYYMGKKLSQAKVSWNANSTRQFTPPSSYEAWHFGDAPQWAHYRRDRDADGNYDDSDSEMDSDWWVNGSLSLDEDGTAVLDMPIPPPDRASLPQIVRVSAEVTDINQQTVGANGEFEVPGSAFLLGLRGPDFFGVTGSDMRMEVVAIDSKGQPGPTGAKVEIKLERQSYHTLKIATAGGASTTKDQVVLTEELKQTVTLQAPSAKSAPTAAITFKPNRGGTYFLSAETTDPQGKKVLSRMPLYVIGGGEFPWALEDGSRINLQPEKSTLTPGQEAVIVVKTPIAGKALVTVERNRVHRHFVVPISPDNPIIRVPVQDAEAPNVFVSVIVVRGAADSPKAHKMPEYRIGYCQLSVDSKQKELGVAITPERDEVRPAETLTIRANVTDHTAAPVAGAEVSLFAVDEGVLSLMAHETPDPSAYFHAPMPLAVDSFTSFADLLPEDVTARQRGNKGFVVGGGGEENNAPLQVRKNFVTTPLWLATAMTDDRGQLTAAVKAPDNLTRYRIMAVAVHGADRFGHGESAFKVNKPLMIEPVVPRFARLGDEVLLKAVLHNTTPHSGEVEVTLQLDQTTSFIREPRFFVPASLKMMAESDPRLQKRTVTLAANETAAVAFPVRFENLGTATWQWTARTTKWAAGAPALNDATESKFEVTHPLPELRDIRYARISGGQPVENLIAKVNPALLEGNGALHVSLSTSRLYEARDALDYVLTYPYGCAEQTSSSTMPWLALSGYQTLFPDLLGAERSKSAIQHGASRLLQMVTDDGGLAYWPGGPESHPWASAYGGLVLMRARDAGATVPEEVVQKLLEYLSKKLRGLENETDYYNITDSALALYTLAKGKKPEPAYQNMLFARRDRIPEAARLYTSLAMCLSDTPHDQIKDMLGWKPSAPPSPPAAKSGAAKSPKAAKAKAPAPPATASPVWTHWAGSGPNKALRLIAYTHLGLTKDAENLAVSILQSRNGRGEWGNTYANAWTLTALSAYERSIKGAAEPLVAKALWDSLAQPLDIPTPPGTAKASFVLNEKLAASPLRLELPEGRTAFARVEASAFPPNRDFEGENHGYAISRQYQKMLANGTAADPENLRVGDMVLVTLNLEIGGGDRYLAINDALPAVLEAINPEFSTQAVNLPVGVEPWFCDHRELRADRALFFTNYAPSKGKFAIRYLARVIAEGETVAPPARIEAMYQPDRYGLTPTHRLRTLPSAAGAVAGN